MSTDQRIAAVERALQQLDAQIAGAFPEDALSEADALASINDPAQSPAEALALTDAE